MAPKVSKHLVVSWLLKAKKRQQSREGFTLIELLVAIIIGAMIVGLLLFVVLELLQVNRREEVLTQTQQNMRRAIDYITSDVSEAVYVYSTPVSVTNITGQLDDLPSGTPIFAFWRLDPLNQAQLQQLEADCSDYATDADEQECGALKIRQSYYTLVVYVQEDNQTGDLWQGQSRIIRYELPKYNLSNLATLEKRDGYADPTLITGGFRNWTKDAGETTNGNAAVLTDYVNIENTVANACPEDTDTTPNNDPNNEPYTRLPADSDSFYVCIRTGEVTDNDGVIVAGTNQSVIVYLTGNATDGNTGLIGGPFSEASRLPTLESEVLIRGVIEKLPN